MSVYLSNYITDKPYSNFLVDHFLHQKLEIDFQKNGFYFLKCCSTFLAYILMF